MFWQKKKKRKKVTKPKVIAQPQQPAEETPQTAESEKKEETPLQKKPAGKKSEKVLDPEKEFLKAFKQLTNRHRSWDIWRDFITMLACALSNPVDNDNKENYWYTPMYFSPVWTMRRIFGGR